MFFIIPIPSRLVNAVWSVFPFWIALVVICILVTLIIAVLAGAIYLIFMTPVGFVAVPLIIAAVIIVLLKRRAKRLAAEAEAERLRQQEYARQLQLRQMAAAKEAEKRARAAQKVTEAARAREARRERKVERHERRELRREKLMETVGRLRPAKVSGTERHRGLRFLTRGTRKDPEG